jgi:mono/diheme cytochrome c family protein
MKLRYILFTLLVLALSACSFSLAEDVTPPPNYISPTPPPTLGPLFPPEAPSIERGAAIFADKCVACHGPKGMGDGDQGKQLPVTVAALGLPQFARPAAPVDWYTTVTRGNIERYMPPFNSLDEQQRWDVITYALSLHASEENLARGKQLFETNCANCPLDTFQDQTKMASLSADKIVTLLKNGGDGVTALSGSLTDEDYYAVADYLRTLTYGVTLPTATPEPPTVTPTVATVEGSPTVEGTPATEAATPVATESTPAVDANGTPIATAETTPVAGSVKISGSLKGTNVSGVTITLHGYDHASDSSGATEVYTKTAATDANGQFVFEGVEQIENRIYVVDTVYQEVTYSSDLIVVTPDQTDYTVPEFTVYETTQDYSTLTFDQAHFFVEAADQSVQVIGVYTFTNKTDKTILVKATVDVPFITMPAEAQNVSYDITQDSAPMMQAEGGFAIPPSEKSYSLVALYTLPYNGKLQLSQPLALDAKSVLVLVPEGMKVKSSQLTAGDMQAFQNANYQSFQGTDFKAGDTITLDISGKAKSGGAASGTTDTRQGLLIGVGALGAMLIAAGAWLYMRDRKTAAEPEARDEEAAMQSEEDILDAIIALDDLHRSGKINDEAYKTRRAELKSRLKDLM